MYLKYIPDFTTFCFGEGHILNIQCDTKNLWFDNIKLSFFANRKKQSFSLIGVVRLLDTLEHYYVERPKDV